jgi:hypothetical protein
MLIVQPFPLFFTLSVNEFVSAKAREDPRAMAI